MVELQNRMNFLQTDLDETQKELFCFRSFQNFVTFNHELTLDFQSRTRGLLIEYIEIIENQKYQIDKKRSEELVYGYILKIGKFYSVELGFKLRDNLQYALTTGIMIDSLLLMAGVLKKAYYLPIATFVMVVRWGYIKIFYENKHRVYGYKY